MKFFKSLVVFSVAACSALSVMAQVNPNRVAPADCRGLPSVATKLVIPVMPVITTESLRPLVAPLIPAPVAAILPGGSYCGRVALYTDTRSITERGPCQGRSVFGPVQTTVYNPATDAYRGGGDNPICYDAVPGYFSVVSVLGGDCPAGYALTTTGSSSPYQYYSCIKS